MIRFHNLQFFQLCFFFTTCSYFPLFHTQGKKSASNFFLTFPLHVFFLVFFFHFLVYKCFHFLEVQVMLSSCACKKLRVSKSFKKENTRCYILVENFISNCYNIDTLHAYIKYRLGHHY